MDTNETGNTLPVPRDAASGLAIAISAVASVVLMSHHPTAHGHDLPAMLENAVRLSSLNKAVHAGMIAVVATLVYGYLGFARRLGAERPLVRLGVVAYVMGAIVHGGAAVLNGLVFPELAARYVDQDSESLESVRAVMVFSFELNQALAGIGLVAWSVAVVAWSLALVRRAGAWRWIGLFGIAVGVVGAGAFLSGNLQLDVHDFGLFILAQGIWNVAVGVALAFTGARAAAAPS